jgi:hypothetical protein
LEKNENCKKKIKKMKETENKQKKETKKSEISQNGQAAAETKLSGERATNVVALHLAVY